MAKNLKAGTVRRIRKMIDAVMHNPKAYNQEQFPDASFDSKHKPICGTDFCAAGHAVAANSPRRFQTLLTMEAQGNGPSWINEAVESLELKNVDGTTRLFGTASDWPHKFHMMYLDADDAKTPAWQARKRAMAFKARWEHFIAVDGDYAADMDA